ncbi:hypothetical protein ACJX0J_030835, partial [Zea mays]
RFCNMNWILYATRFSLCYFSVVDVARAYMLLMYILGVVLWGYKILLPEFFGPLIEVLYFQNVIQTNHIILGIFISTTDVTSYRFQKETCLKIIITTQKVVRTKFEIWPQTCCEWQIHKILHLVISKYGSKYNGTILVFLWGIGETSSVNHFLSYICDFFSGCYKARSDSIVIDELEKLYTSTRS